MLGSDNPPPGAVLGADPSSKMLPVTHLSPPPAYLPGVPSPPGSLAREVSGCTIPAPGPSSPWSLESLVPELAAEAPSRFWHSPAPSSSASSRASGGHSSTEGGPRRCMVGRPDQGAWCGAGWRRGSCL